MTGMFPINQHCIDTQIPSNILCMLWPTIQMIPSDHNILRDLPYMAYVRTHRTTVKIVESKFRYSICSNLDDNALHSAIPMPKAVDPTFRSAQTSSHIQHTYMLKLNSSIGMSAKKIISTHVRHWVEAFPTEGDIDGCT
jgi:hypothetical protein